MAQKLPDAAHTKAGTSSPPELLPDGIAFSRDALTGWFQRTYDRVPTERELGVLENAMAMRDSTPPCDGPDADPYGWTAESFSPGPTKWQTSER